MTEKIIVYTFVIHEPDANPEITDQDKQRVINNFENLAIEIEFISPKEWNQPEINSIENDFKAKFSDIGHSIRDFMLVSKLHPDFEEMAKDIFIRGMGRAKLISDITNGKAFLAFPLIKKG